MKAPWRAAAAAMLLVPAVAGAQILYTYAQPVAAAPPMSDDDLAYTVAKAIKDDDSLRSALITLKVVDHRVVLEGVALSQEQQRQARAVAEWAVGPERVVSEIEVAR